MINCNTTHGNIEFEYVQGLLSQECEEFVYDRNGGWNFSFTFPEDTTIKYSLIKTKYYKY